MRLVPALPARRAEPVSFPELLEHGPQRVLAVAQRAESLFGTWQVQGQDTLEACRQMLIQSAQNPDPAPAA